MSDCHDHREEVDALLDHVQQQIFSLARYHWSSRKVGGIATPFPSRT